MASHILSKSFIKFSDKEPVLDKYASTNLLYFFEILIWLVRGQISSKEQVPEDCKSNILIFFSNSHKDVIIALNCRDSCVLFLKLCKLSCIPDDAIDAALDALDAALEALDAALRVASQNLSHIRSKSNSGALNDGILNSDDFNKALLLLIDLPKAPPTFPIHLELA